MPTPERMVEGLGIGAVLVMWVLYLLVVVAFILMPFYVIRIHSRLREIRDLLSHRQQHQARATKQAPRRNPAPWEEALLKEEDSGEG